MGVSTQMPPVKHLARAEVEGNLQQIDEWRDRWLQDVHAREFIPSPFDAWSVEMHAFAIAYEELARSYLRSLTALEHIRREPNHAEYVTHEFLGPRPSPETTATDDDGDGMIVSAEGWEVRLRFPVEHEEVAHEVFDRLIEHGNGLQRHGVQTIWFQELVWIRAPHLLEGEELRSIGRRFERL